MTVDVEVKGLIELQRKMDQMVMDVHGAPIVNAMRDSELVVVRSSRINSPVDTGRLRASIIAVPPITTGETIQGVIGTNVEYAPYQEFGTRRGLKGRFYMTRAFESNRNAIVRRFERAIAEIVNK